MEDHVDDGEKHPARRNAVGLTESIPTPEKRLRMVVLGASGVGKTQLVSRFLGRPFNASYLPTAEDFHRTKYMIRGRTYQLDILDTSGQTLSPVMKNLTLLTGDLFLVVYSVADRGSWERAKELVSLVEEVTRDPTRTNRCIERSFKSLLFRSTYQGEKFSNGIQEKAASPKRGAPIPIVVVGSKCDIQKVQVPHREVLEWLRQRPNSSTSKVDHFSASAKSDQNVQTLFDRLFAMSHLPCEMSPNMHRKVPEDVYSITSAVTRTKISARKAQRPRSAEFTGSPKFRRRSMSKKTIHLRAEPGCRSSGSSWSNSSSDNEDAVPKAIATVCENQRRPSVDTDVLLAFAKVRSYSPETDEKRRPGSDHHINTVTKLKRQMFKFKSSTH